MRKLKTGLGALLIYSILAAAAYGVTTHWNWHPGFIYTITFMLSIVIWYEALNRSFKKDIERGLGVIIAYIIPSLIISYLNYGAGAAEAGETTLKTVIYQLFHMPFIYGLNATSIPADHPLLMLFFPSLMMLILTIYPFARNISEAIEAQHTQYIYR